MDELHNSLWFVIVLILGVTWTHLHVDISVIEKQHLTESKEFNSCIDMIEENMTGICRPKTKSDHDRSNRPAFSIMH